MTTSGTVSASSPATGAGDPAPTALFADTGRAVALSWIVTRALVLMTLAYPRGGVTGDPTYYGRSLLRLVNGTPPSHVLIEYPTPVFALLLPPFAISGGYVSVYVGIFCICMLVTDAIFTGVLWRVSGRHRRPAVDVWLAFVLLIGPVAFLRFDLVPAVLAGVAILLAARRPGIAGGLTALGAGLKFWPAALVAAFVLPVPGERRAGRRARLVLFFLLTGAVIAVGSVLAAGWDRAFTPLQWQANRGLQIESVAATPAMIARGVRLLSGPDTAWTVQVTRYKAFEISGPGTQTAIQVSRFATGAVLVLLALLWLRAYVAAHRADAVPVGQRAALITSGWFVLATSLVVTVANKTLSPQYLIWIGGPLAAVACLGAVDAPLRHAIRVTLLVAALTQAEFPWLYPMLVHRSWTATAATGILAARNVLLVYLTWYACREVWRRTVPRRGARTRRATPAV